MNGRLIWLLVALACTGFVSCFEDDDIHDPNLGRFARASPLRWGKRASNNILRWGKRSADEENQEARHTRDRREAPLR